jgi:hypothetical protein
VSNVSLPSPRKRCVSLLAQLKSNSADIGGCTAFEPCRTACVYALDAPHRANIVTVGDTRKFLWQPPVRRLFLLSPANINGIRAGLLMGENGHSELAYRLQRGGAPLGELFSFMSSLYFRAKLAYARAFAVAPPGLPGSFVITASAGLVSPDKLVTLERLREMSAVDVDPSDTRYRGPLERDSRMLLALAGLGCEMVLLGSIATPKYVEPLVGIFGKQLLFPAEFIGRGDMSRGGLMLRRVQAGIPLTYIPVLDARRHGVRPPKLAPMRRAKSAG